MKKCSLFLVVVFVLFTSCTSMGLLEDDLSFETLGEDEGFVVMRIHNETAGKTLGFYSASGKEINIPELKLNSDIEIRRGPISFTSLVIKNDKNPQLVITKAKKGIYGIVKVGKNSDYMSSYLFTVEPGAVNYIGDIYLKLIEGGVPLFSKPKDYYTIAVEDNFDTIANEISYIRAFELLPLVNISTPQEPRRPEFCPID